jgi:hypothetical protein
MVIYLSALFAIIGLLIYLASGNPKVSEVGRVTYFGGLLAFLITAVPHLVQVLR